MQKNFASFCIVSHGVFHGQNGVNIEISVLYPFYGPFGRSINVSTSHFFNCKVLFSLFQQKKIGTVCIISHGVFHKQNGVNNKISVLNLFYGPFGHSINVSTSLFFNRKVLFLPFFQRKKKVAELGGSKISHGLFKIQ